MLGRVLRSAGWVAAILVSLAAPVGECIAAGHLISARPAEYAILNPLLTADGVITYHVNLGGLLWSPSVEYDPERIARLEAAVKRAFDKWNDVLAPLGLAFEPVEDLLRAELPVIALDYGTLPGGNAFGNTVAGANSIPLGPIYTPLPMVFNSAQDLHDLSDRPTVLGPTLAQPYVRYVDQPLIDIYSVTLHEIGHVLGLAHTAGAIRSGRNYNFLGLPSVQIDPRCLEPSEYCGWEHIEPRRPILQFEMDTLMTPINPGAVFEDIPPEDRAFVAFALRHLNPDGADEVLREARRIDTERNPMRYANVREELEKTGDGADNNDDPDRAMTVQPGQIIVASLSYRIEEESSDLRALDPATADIDVYRFDVEPEQVGRTWVFDVDGGAGLPGLSWADTSLELLDAQRRTIAFVQDAREVDEGSLSTMDPYLVWHPPAPGPYYLRVRSLTAPGLEGSLGMYLLGVGIDAPPAPGPERRALEDPSLALCEEPSHPGPAAGPCGAIDPFALIGALATAVIMPAARPSRAAGPRHPL